MKGIKRRLPTSPPTPDKNPASVKPLSAAAAATAAPPPVAHRVKGRKVSEDDSDEDEDDEEGEDEDLDEEEALETEEGTIKYLQRENKKQKFGSEVGGGGMSGMKEVRSCSKHNVHDFTYHFFYTRRSLHFWWLQRQQRWELGWSRCHLVFGTRRKQPSSWRRQLQMLVALLGLLPDSRRVLFRGYPSQPCQPGLETPDSHGGYGHGSAARD